MRMRSIQSGRSAACCLAVFFTMGLLVYGRLGHAADTALRRAKQLEQDERLAGFNYVETGIGRYRVHSSSDTGASEPEQAFFIVNLAAELSYLLENDWSLAGSLGYGARVFDGSGSRNDSDLSWRAGVNRALGEGDVDFGLRGKLSYVGNSDYRKDYGVFAGWRRKLGLHDEISLGADLLRRQYPRGPFRDGSRTIADAHAEWIRSLWDDRASFSLAVHGGYQYATRRPDGDSGFYGLSTEFDYTFTDRLSAFVFAGWERNRFNADRIHFHPEQLEEASILRRRDVLYEFSSGLVWEFAATWSLEPAILYLHDASNTDDFHYSSTEIWANVRKSL